MTLTSHRVIQYVVILLLSLGVGVSWYEWQKSRAALKINTQAETAPTEGLVGYWKFDEGSGVSAADSSGNAGTGTLTNGPTWTTGKIGGAVSFDGVNDLVSLGNTSAIRFTGNGTMSAWVYLDPAWASTAVVMLKNTDQSGSGWGMSLNVNNTRNPYFNVVHTEGGDHAHNLTSTQVVPTGQWILLTGIWDGTNLKMYINGALTDSLNIGSGTVRVNSLGPGGGIGANNNTSDAAPTNVFRGSLDEARVYNRALSDLEVRQIYEYMGQTGLNAGLVAHYTFDEPDMGVTTVFDRSGSGNRGTLTNGPTKVAGRIGQALNFDGVNDYVTSPHASNLNFAFNQNFSIGMWLKIPTTQRDTGFTTNEVLQKWDGSASGYPYSIRLQNQTGSSPGLISMTRWDQTNAPSVVSTSRLNDNRWHRVDFTKNGATLSVYVDGVLEAVATDTTTGTTTNSHALNAAVRGGAGLYYLTGALDDIRIYNRSLSTTEIQALYNLAKPDVVNNISQKDVLSESLAGYWKLDEGSGTTTADASGNGGTGTLTNMETPGDWITGQIRGGLDFDGANEYVDIPDNSNALFDPGTKDMTVSAWINTDNATAAQHIVAHYDSGPPYNGWGIALNVNTAPFCQSGKICLWDASGSWNGVNSGITAGSWYHIAFVRTGTVGTFYVNGVNKGTVTTLATLANSTASLRIGYSSTAAAPFDGKIDEVRIYQSAFSAEDVNRLYQETAPTGVDTGLVGYWPMNGDDISGTTAFDRSGRGNNGTMTNGPAKAIGKIGQALDFFPNRSDTNAYVSVGDPASGILDFGSGDFTISTWVKLRGYVAQGSGVNTIIGKHDFGAAIGPWYGLLLDSNHKAKFSIKDAGGSSNEIITTQALNDNVWHHLVAIRSGSTVYLYVDGASTPTGAPVSVGSVSTNEFFTIGSDGTNFRNIDGFIDEVRVYNRAISVGEVQSLYDYGKSDKVNTASTSPLSEGLAAYWKLDDGSGVSATDSGGNSNTGTLTNGPTWTTGQIGGAVDFDGADDFMSYGTTIQFDSNDFSVSAWIYREGAPGGTTQSNPIFLQRNSTSGDGSAAASLALGITFQPGFSVRDNVGAIVSALSPTATNASQWYHLVGVKRSNRILLYVDGTVVAQTAHTRSGDFDAGVNLRLIGKESYDGIDRSWFNGRIDEVRVYRRALSDDDVTQLYRTTAPSGVDTGLVGYWPMNGKDISGTTVFDRSGRGNNGTMTNGPAKAIGKIGQALDFFPNGSDANTYVNFGDPASGALDFSGDFTTGFWMKGDGYATQGSSVNVALVKKVIDTASSLGYTFNYGSANQMIFQAGNGSSSASITAPGATTGDSAWHHYMATRSGSTITLYIDGSTVGTASLSGTLATSQSLFIGSDSAVERNTNAVIDEVRLYNRALSSDEILGLYNRGK